jgi:hypothetical protein
MAATRSTRDCFRECIGKRVVGVLFDALPEYDPDLARGGKALVFGDGTALTIMGSGTYWITQAEEVRRAIQEKQSGLARIQRDIADLAGVDSIA